MLTGPRTLTADEAIERFAELNQIDLEVAAGQFEPGSPWPKHMVVGARILSADAYKGDRGSGGAVEDAWRKQHGVSATTQGPKVYYLGKYLAYTAGWRSSKPDTTGVMDQAQAVMKPFELSYAPRVLDHVRDFGHNRRFAGFLSAPYIYWYDDYLLHFVRAVRSLGLEVRIGYEEDAYYNHGTPPIVIWNPEIVDLPFIGKSVVSDMAGFNGPTDHSELIMRDYHKCQNVPRSMYAAEQLEAGRLRELLLSGQSLNAASQILGVRKTACVSRARRLVEKGELPPTVVGYE